MDPICKSLGWALWYSPDDGGYYWQDDDGCGDNTSPVYPRQLDAMTAIHCFRAMGSWPESIT